MKFHVISDLHIDFSKYDYPFPACDVVVIAGDIGEDPEHLVDICRNNPEHKIIFIPGNHDFYGASVLSRMICYSEIQNKICNNLVVLQDSFVNISGVLFYGSTLWSGLNAYGLNYVNRLKEWYERSIADTRYINSWSSHSMIQEHLQSKSALAEFFEKHKEQKKVVITHFAPSLKSVHAQYKNQVPFNSYWCNGFSDDFISNADVWIHGHVHNNFDYNVFSEGNLRSCRIVCNPRGYCTEYGKENLEFNSKLVIEV